MTAKRPISCTTDVVTWCPALPMAGRRTFNFFKKSFRLNLFVLIHFFSGPKCSTQFNFWLKKVEPFNFCLPCCCDRSVIMSIFILSAPAQVSGCCGARQVWWSTTKTLNSNLFILEFFFTFFSLPQFKVDKCRLKFVFKCLNLIRICHQSIADCVLYNFAFELMAIGWKLKWRMRKNGAAYARAIFWPFAA